MNELGDLGPDLLLINDTINGTVEPTEYYPPNMHDPEWRWEVEMQDPPFHNPLAVLINISMIQPPFITKPLYAVVVPTILLASCITNSLIFVVVNQKGMRSPTNIVLVSMAAAELATGLSSMPWSIYYLIADIEPDLEMSDSWCTFHQLFALHLPALFHTASIWLTCYLAIQRFFYIFFPAFVIFYNHRFNKRMIIGLCFWALVSEVPKFFFKSLENHPGRSGRRYCLQIHADWIEHYIGFKLFNLAGYMYKLFFVHIIPCTILVTFTFMLFCRLRDQNRLRKELFGKAEDPEVVARRNREAAAAEAAAAAAEAATAAAEAAAAAAREEVVRVEEGRVPLAVEEEMIDDVVEGVVERMVEVVVEEGEEAIEMVVIHVEGPAEQQPVEALPVTPREEQQKEDEPSSSSGLGESAGGVSVEAVEVVQAVVEVVEEEAEEPAEEAMEDEQEEEVEEEDEDEEQEGEEEDDDEDDDEEEEEEEQEEEEENVDERDLLVVNEVDNPEEFVFIDEEPREVLHIVIVEVGEDGVEREIQPEEPVERAEGELQQAPADNVFITEQPGAQTVDVEAGVVPPTVVVTSEGVYDPNAPWNKLKKPGEPGGPPKDLQSSTKLLFVIVSLHLIVEVPVAALLIARFVAGHLELDLGGTFFGPEFTNVFMVVRNFLIILTYPFNFSIYFGMSSNFKQEFFGAFCMRCFRRCRRRLLNSSSPSDSDDWRRRFSSPFTRSTENTSRRTTLNPPSGLSPRNSRSGSSVSASRRDLIRSGSRSELYDAYRHSERLL